MCNLYTPTQIRVWRINRLHVVNYTNKGAPSSRPALNHCRGPMSGSSALRLGLSKRQLQESDQQTNRPRRGRRVSASQVGNAEGASWVPDVWRRVRRQLVDWGGGRQQGDCQLPCDIVLLQMFQFHLARLFCFFFLSYTNCVR